MLKILEVQARAFESTAILRFEDDLTAHLAIHFDVHARVLGPRGLRACAAYATQRATQRGCRRERDIFLFASVAAIFGAHFDEDPFLPWAQEVLDRRIAIETRMEELSERAVEQFESMYGSGGVELPRSYNRVARSIGDRQDAGVPEADVEDLLVTLIPTKARLIGQAALRRGSLTMMNRASRLGLGTAAGSLMPVLGFLLGSGFDRDPVHAELMKALVEGNVGGQGSKPAALRQASRRHLNRWLDAFAKESTPERSRRRGYDV